MIKPNLLVVWPLSCDYPLFRYNLKRFREFFQDIYIGFTNHHQEEDYSAFVRQDLDFAHCVDIEFTSGGDWRDDAISQLLDVMTPCEHVLFIEQDFLIKDETFFERLFAQDHDFLYYNEGNNRVHPAFALIRRDIIEKTHRNFGAVPPKDHFGWFFDEVFQQTTGENIENFVKEKEDFYHMAGLTQNYKCVKYGDCLFRPKTFFYFNYKSTLLPNLGPFKEVMIPINANERPETHDFLDNFFPC